MADREQIKAIIKYMRGAYPNYHPKPPKPARVVKFDPAQMDAVITFLRAHERPLPRVYARGGKLVKS